MTILLITVSHARFNPLTPVPDYLENLRDSFQGKPVNSPFIPMARCGISKNGRPFREGIMNLLVNLLVNLVNLRFQSSSPRTIQGLTFDQSVCHKLQVGRETPSRERSCEAGKLQVKGRETPSRGERNSKLGEEKLQVGETPSRERNWKSEKLHIGRETPSQGNSKLWERNSQAAKKPKSEKLG